MTRSIDYSANARYVFQQNLRYVVVSNGAAIGYRIITHNLYVASALTPAGMQNLKKLEGFLFKIKTYKPEYFKLQHEALEKLKQNGKEKEINL